MTVSAQGHDLALEEVQMPLIHSPSSCLSTPPIKQLLFPMSGRKSWGPQESPHASPQAQAAHLPRPNPEPSPCSPFTHLSSSAWLILNLPKISDPLFHFVWGFSPWFFKPHPPSWS